ncbi:MAG: nucleoside deaminase [Bacteroidales bacterium]|nr:nucleoside deaminase [Bacteroidales bacterium]
METTENNVQDKDVQMMREALREAEAARVAGEVPIGAVVVCKGRIIARAHNLTEMLHDSTAHAEMQAITIATEYLGGKYLSDCTLYVTVEPCPMCAAALNWSQLPRLVYGCADPRRGYSLFSPSLLHPRTEVRSGVLAEACAALMTTFFKEKR